MESEARRNIKYFVDKHRGELAKMAKVESKGTHRSRSGFHSFMTEVTNRKPKTIAEGIQIFQKP